MASNNYTVLVAMSGGVDSSTAAALLVERNFQVIGVTMQMRREADEQNGRGASERSGPSRRAVSSVEDARRVASMLGIEHHVLDLRELFRKAVVEPFIAEYRAGRTPNPCIACNRRVKFHALIEMADELGARFVATGHYARVERDSSAGRFLLLRGADRSKDQSYALCGLAQEQLARVLFPLGAMTKREVRKKAESLGLPVAAKRESQDICFVPDGDYARFIREAEPGAVRPGPILDTSGRVLGQHEGIAFFTIGQRHGLRLNSRQPLYIVAIDAKRDAVIVGGRDELSSRSVLVRDVNFVSVAELNAAVRVFGKLRSTMPEAACALENADEGRLLATFDEGQRAVTPGQAAVFYDGDRVLCGGVIERALR
jgi:tRNA-specific 2-thiouridylase